MIVELSRRAQRDLTDIGLWIAQDDPDAAQRFVQRLQTACHGIGERPTLYPLITGSQAIRKRLFAKRYLILFRIRGSAVIIVSIRHGARQAIYT